MKAEITPGQVSDYRGYDAVMDDHLPQPKVLIADKGYDSDAIREEVATPGRHRRHPGQKDTEHAGTGRRLHLCPAQPRRTLHQQAQERPARRHPIRQDRSELSWVHRDYLGAAVAPPFVNLT